MNFVFKTRRSFALKTRNFVSKMMNFAGTTGATPCSRRIRSGFSGRILSRIPDFLLRNVEFIMKHRPRRRVCLRTAAAGSSNATQCRALRCSATTHRWWTRATDLSWSTPWQWRTTRRARCTAALPAACMACTSSRSTHSAKGAARQRHCWGTWRWRVAVRVHVPFLYCIYMPAIERSLSDCR